MNLGELYSRREISRLLGGEEVIYLPSKDGYITAGCFDPKLNRRAPLEVDVGDRTRVVERARQLGQSKAKIPVFLKQSNKAWKYIGIYKCLSYSEERKDIEAYTDRREDAVGVLYFKEVERRQNENAPSTEVMELEAAEGKKRLITHLRKERSRGLIIAKRNEARVNYGHLICEVCGLNEKKLPKGIGEACFEVHHNRPLASLHERSKTRLSDLSLVCANCHRLIHRNVPMLTISELQNLRK